MLPPPPSRVAHYFEVDGVCSNIQLVSYICPLPLPQFLVMFCVRLKMIMTIAMNGNFAEHVLQKIGGACVDTKPRDIKVNLHHQLLSPVVGCGYASQW